MILLQKYCWKSRQIVLEILRSEFGKEIEEFVSRQVMSLNSDELEFF